VIGMPLLLKSGSAKLIFLLLVCFAIIYAAAVVDGAESLCILVCLSVCVVMKRSTTLHHATDNAQFHCGVH